VSLKTFNEFLSEAEIPNQDQSLGKKRHQMPQIVDHAAFLDDLKSSGKGFSEGESVAKDLFPTQSNFNEKKVEHLQNLYDSGESATLKPIVTTKDGFVLDGHHRWLAVARQPGDKNIDVFQLEMDIDEALAFLKDKPYTENRKIDESRKWDPDLGWVGGGTDESDVNPFGNRVSHYKVDSKGRNQLNKDYERDMSRVYMDVKFADRDKAKSEGMRWDPMKKAWYHTDPKKLSTTKFKQKR